MRCSTIVINHFINIFFISVQAPLAGINVMKERIHLNNFTNTLAEAVILYNSNDVQFITKVSL
jgi:hypothetical protein